MVQPEIDGMELLGAVGEGTCGSIFIARVLEGSEPPLPGIKWYAVRVFNAIAINRNLIESVVRRLESGSYPASVVPIAWRESKQGSRCMIMPMLAEVDEKNATIAIRCLQDHLADYPATDAWPVVEKLARALGEMHRRKIPHGNVKPGNIFFKEDGNIYLTDFAMGQMPGVGMTPRPETLLYAPPEQISDPDGYLDGKGYGWDTFAFAAIAFRLLTGKTPQCEAMSHKGQPASGPADAAHAHTDAREEPGAMECLDLETWSRDCDDPYERKRRGVITRCLSLDPEERYCDMNEVLRLWEDIDADARAGSEKLRLRKRIRRNKLVTVSSLMLAGGCVWLCVMLFGLLAKQKMERGSDLETFNKTITALEAKTEGAEDMAFKAIKAKQDTETSGEAFQRRTAATLSYLRNQVGLMSITNDRLVEWLMRTSSKELPELEAPDPASEVIARELRELLRLTEGDPQATPIRTAALMQLAELEIHQNKTASASAFIDQAELAVSEASGDDGRSRARIARARLACLLQALEHNDISLAEAILPKARKGIEAIPGDDEKELRRINAVMQMIDGSMIASSEPAKALVHFQLALKDLEELHQALPEHVAMRTQISRYALKSASIAESLDLFDDAAQMRSMAANHLRAILNSNPDLKLAKIDLAKIEILSAESDLRSGDDINGAAKLKAAEGLLAGLSTDDVSPHGASMQMATAMGLRSIMLRDQGRRTDAGKLLEEAIEMSEKIVAAHPGAREPLYRLAVFHWQRASLHADAGNSKDKLSEGKQAAELMQKLLKQGGNSREIELRRSLAYLYGDLGQTAQNTGQRNDAIAYFDDASAMWQSLIDVHERNMEYLDGLKWSRSRYRQLGGK